jgi:hypothetical protein
MAIFCQYRPARNHLQVNQISIAEMGAEWKRQGGEPVADVRFKLQRETADRRTNSRRAPAPPPNGAAVPSW